MGTPLPNIKIENDGDCGKMIKAALGDNIVISYLEQRTSSD